MFSSRRNTGSNAVRQRRLLSALVIGTTLLSVTAIAAAPDIADAIKARRTNYKEIGGAFKTISDEVKTGAPIIDVIAPAAQEILRRGKMQMNFFPVGSGPESGEKTHAKAVIWSELDNFHKLHQDFLDAATNLNTAIASGDVATITKAQQTLGKACKSCHDRYRERD